MKKIFAFALLVLYASTAFAVSPISQDEQIGMPGSEQPLFQQKEENGNACYVFADYIFKTVTSEDVGEDIKVFKRRIEDDGQNACANSTGQPYFTLSNTDANYFFGRAGDKFFVDSGTSAGVRGLDVVSLKTRKVVFSTEYNADVKLAGDTVIYNKPSNVKGSLKACPNWKKWRKEGGGEAWVRSTRLDLTTLKEVGVKQLTCVYQE